MVWIMVSHSALKFDLNKNGYRHGWGVLSHYCAAVFCVRSSLLSAGANPRGSLAWRSRPTAGEDRAHA